MNKKERIEVLEETLDILQKQMAHLDENRTCDETHNMTILSNEIRCVLEQIRDEERSSP